MQPHGLAQSVDEHGGNARAFIGLAGFLLDDRGKGHQFLRGLERQVLVAALPDPCQGAVAGAAHALDHRHALGAAGELVGIGQQRAFGRNFANLADQDFILLQALDDLLAGQPFGNGEFVQDRLALDQEVHDVAHAGMFGKQVLAGLELVAGLGQEHAGEKQRGVVDDAFALQASRNLAQGLAPGHDDRAGLNQRPRRLELLLGDEENCARHHEQENHQTDQPVEQHGERVSMCAHVVRR